MATSGGCGSATEKGATEKGANDWRHTQYKPGRRVYGGRMVKMICKTCKHNNVCPGGFEDCTIASPREPVEKKAREAKATQSEYINPGRYYRQMVGKTMVTDIDAETVTVTWRGWGNVYPPESAVVL